MSAEPQSAPPKFLENSLLIVAFLLAHAPLWYQLPRWVQGLDPTFVHPAWIERSPFPIFLYMAKVHPVIWIVITTAICIRAFRNYGWKLER
ncbi:MAG TPA: hypothetical protein VLT36_21290 [Candidatus Dormibacteraeota bacterium]|nr:hypothetical protein [Candidatus Dormibacteraeota bacterium]